MTRVDWLLSALLGAGVALGGCGAVREEADAFGFALGSASQDAAGTGGSGQPAPNRRESEAEGRQED
ncbi:MAG TPA: hypothetical protein PK095_14075, partial [Myxococcota bacterium]|nr:hypothetical protein [Myxococcota bacterium]